MVQSEIKYDGPLDKLKFISDTHFYHFNIIEYCSRPFKDVITMNEFIVGMWNKIVDPDDIVIFLGDFSFAGVNKSKELFNRLNGKVKFAVKGNHDKNINWLKNIGFNEVFKSLDIVTKDVVIHCSHIFRNPSFKHQVKNFFGIRPKNFYIHGHSHNYRPFYAGEYPVFNISAEVIRYLPVSLQELININKKKSYLTFYHPFQRSTYKEINSGK